mmetsp:Transcript_29923/g.71299  ORF Transcript_29923/g.71299 Transcript_29923/m.71299 type:complete len:500 (+) Transcript_29923:63-1562(+)
MPLTQKGLWIAGGWLSPSRGLTLPVVNPATEEVVGSIPRGTHEDVDRAVSVANHSFVSGVWASAPASYRSRVLSNIAREVLQQKQRLARIESIDCGKPLSESEWDMEDVAACFDFYAQLVEKLDSLQGTNIKLPLDEFSGHFLWEPIGVVALITPWNYPLLMASWKVAPALAAGCSCVLKPSELASLTCLELAAIAHEAGVPSGVLNVVTGLGAEAGAALSAHPGVAKVAFTGSPATGRLVALSAAENLRPVSLELGGKSPLVIFEDADIDNAVEWAMFGGFWTNGQICTATSRVLVAEAISDEFFRRLKARAEQITPGDPMCPDCRLGPVVSAAQHAKVLGYIEGAISEGATLLTGGGRPPHMPAGYYVLPTVFVGVTEEMAIWKEEVFGPVLACTTFQTEDEAVRLANSSSYGLAAAIISKDTERCKRMTSAFRCGIVWVNCSQPCFVEMPWGGLKRSGYGRDLGEPGLHKYLSLKAVTTYKSDKIWDWYSPQKSKL